MLMQSWSRMEAGGKGRGRGKGKNLGFCFPKSTRSSRGRGEGSRNGPKDTCCFELLATVAGQLLQESVDLKAGQNNSVSFVEKGTTNIATSVVEPQMSHITQQTNMEEVSEIATNEEESCDGIDLLAETYHPLVTPLKRVESFKTARGESSLGKEYDEINKYFPRIARQHEDKEPLMQGKDVVDDYDPTLVSSSSSEDAPSFSQKHKISELTTLRHDNSCLKAREDDGNSSESTVMKTNSAKALRSSSMKASRARKTTHTAVKTRARGSVSKRKWHDFEEAVNSCPAIDPSSYHPGEGLGKEAFAMERCCHCDGAVKRTKACMGESDCLTHPPLIHDHVDNGYCPSASKSQKAVKGCSFTSSPHASASSPKNSTKSSGDSRVELKINSFQIPELFVELPESATVANLKKAVMEAAMNLLGNGLCVRVLLEGKKVLDETASLLQSGISGKANSSCLSFMLEPSSMPTSTTAEDSLLVLSQVGNHSSSWYSIFPKASDLSTANGHASASESAIERDVTHSETQPATAKPSDMTCMPESSGALILHPSQGGLAPQGLGVVPLEQKASDTGASKRRMRRPFTVYEVEALVRAVEKLGTGRWRDVKLHAFAESKHRTYVDLKDKWKTLVHTASIAPHQRRGEPVPQGLLDRVIHAHSYWTANTSSQAAICGN